MNPLGHFALRPLRSYIISMQLVAHVFTHLRTARLFAYAARANMICLVNDYLLVGPEFFHSLGMLLQSRVFPLSVLPFCFLESQWILYLADLWPVKAKCCF